MGFLGLGLGIGIGYVEAQNAHFPLAVWLLLALAFWLVYRAGKRRSFGGVAVAKATAKATAKAQSAAQSSAAVNVFVGVPNGNGESGQRSDQARRWPDLDSASWLSVTDEGEQRALSVEDEYRQLTQGVDPELVDGRDPVEVIEEATDGKIAPP